MDKPVALYAKYGQALRYLVVGGLTTGVNIVLFFALTHLGVAWFWANLVAWALSVLFAFVANRRVVFASHSTHLWREAASFFALRGASLGADTVILFIGLTLLHGSPLVVKLIDQVVVIALNYLFSKRIFAA